MSRTLLLDNDQTSPSLMERYLITLSHSVTCSQSVLGALNRLDRESFDFLVIQLPFREQIGALALCRVLKSDAKTSATRVLMISDAPRMRQKARAAGVDAILNSPFSLEEIRFTLQTLAERHGGSQPLLLGMTVHEAVQTHGKALLGWSRGPV
jgi:CheY-like chemotaxis protein